MQIRSSNILAGRVGVERDEIIVRLACLYSHNFVSLHYEYSIHSHCRYIALHILYVFRVGGVYTQTSHTLWMLLWLFCCCWFFHSLSLALLWYFLVRNTDDRLFHTTLITSSVLIWTFLMFNHFNKNVISRRERKMKHIFCCSYAGFQTEFMLFLLRQGGRDVEGGGGLLCMIWRKPSMRECTFNKHILKLSTLLWIISGNQNKELVRFINGIYAFVCAFSGLLLSCVFLSIDGNLWVKTNNYGMCEKT